MRQIIVRTRVYLGLLASLLLAPAWAQDWQAKIAPSVLRARSQTVEMLVVLSAQADLRSAAGLRSQQARGAWVVERLQTQAAQTQAPLQTWLRSQGAEVQPFWIVNMLWVKAPATLIPALAQRADVLRIEPNPRAALPPPLDVAPTVAADLAAIQPNLSVIHAPDAWALGYTGQNVVIGGADTGYQWDHPALKPHYRGWNGTSATHSYNWHDAIHSGGGSCGANAVQPCDDGSHGTHTLGIMVGADGGANQIGVAPSARWIGCRNMDQGNGTPATYAECF